MLLKAGLTLEPQPNNWYVITGGPSTGKTTLLTELEKLGYKTLPEAARSWIDENLAKGVSVEQLRANEQHFQEDVVRLKQRIEARLDPSEILFFDRGMHDTIAYMQFYHYNIEPWVEAFTAHAQYKKVFLLEPLRQYTQDYARTEDKDFTEHITKLLRDSFATHGMEPIYVPAVSPKERVAFVLAAL